MKAKYALHAEPEYFEEQERLADDPPSEAMIILRAQLAAVEREDGDRCSDWQRFAREGRE